MPNTDTDTLYIETQGQNLPAGIAQLTLNKPEKHNAFDDVLITELTQAIEQLENNSDVRVIVLSATGKSFSAGADLDWMKKSATYSKSENRRDAEKLAALMMTLKSSSKPTIANIQGAVFGGGMGLVACCDIAIALETALFSLSEVRLGLVPAVIAPHVVNAIGARATQALTLTAEKFDAAHAHRLGLIHLLAKDNAEKDALLKQVCDNLLRGAPDAQASAKKFISTLDNCAITTNIVQQSVELIADIRSRPEAKEGIDAFFNKRQPAWCPDRLNPSR